MNPCYGPYLGTNWKAQCDAQFLADLTAVCVAGKSIIPFPNPDFDTADDFFEACAAGATAAYTVVSAAFHYWHQTQCDNGCNLNACILAGRDFPTWCCPWMYCQCSIDQHFDALPPINEWGTWWCDGCSCLWTNSPLVLHLGDYLGESGAQNWWREGFCGPDGKTVCLDWRGDGKISCTAWTSPETDVAFVIKLNSVDTSQLAAGVPVRAQPWRHFFGNVTKGPDGEFPFAHGFEALATHCGQSSGDNFEINLSECGSSLHAWADRSGDGYIDPEELIEFQTLGIEALGDVRRTGKKDQCGNTFPAESHARCSNRPGRCGTWLDVFFESRYPAGNSATAATNGKVCSSRFDGALPGRSSER